MQEHRTLQVTEAVIVVIVWSNKCVKVPVVVCGQARLTGENRSVDVRW